MIVSVGIFFANHTISGITFFQILHYILLKLKPIFKTNKNSMRNGLKNDPKIALSILDPKIERTPNLFVNVNRLSHCTVPIYAT